MISVIMSVYNNEDYIEQAVRSVLEQTYSDFEFLIIDDNSSDNSYKILKKISITDQRIKLYKNSENKGLTKNLNYLMQKAKGDFIARMDGDDICMPLRFEKQMNAFSDGKIKADIIFTDTMLIDHNSRDICPSWRPENIKKIMNTLDYISYIPHPTIMIRSAVLRENPYNEKFKTGQDTELWKRLKNKKYAFYYIDEILLKFRINPNSVRDSDTYGALKYARACLNHKSNLAAFRYFDRIRVNERIKLVLKMLVPHAIRRFNGRIRRKNR